MFNCINILWTGYILQASVVAMLYTGTWQNKQTIFFYNQQDITILCLVDCNLIHVSSKFNSRYLTDLPKQTWQQRSKIIILNHMINEKGFYTQKTLYRNITAIYQFNCILQLRLKICTADFSFLHVLYTQPRPCSLLSMCMSPSTGPHNK